MKDALLQFYLCGLFSLIGNGDLESELKSIGADIGQRIVLLEDFKRECDIDSLLYKITYTLLPALYKSERLIEKSRTEKETYFLYENSPLFSRYSSNSDVFCSEAVVSGMLEDVLRSSGFNYVVTAYSVPKKELPDRIVYKIAKTVSH